MQHFTLVNGEGPQTVAARPKSRARHKGSLALSTHRRSLLKGLAACAAGYGLLRFGLPAAVSLVKGEFDFSSLPRAPGFRKISGGAVSGRSDPLIGLEVPPASVPIPDIPLCDMLFSQIAGAQALPVAYFSDYNCTYCRDLTPRLLALQAEGAISLAWHELPLLGPSSLVAARGALAAQMQDGLEDFHARLMQGRFLPTIDVMIRLAQESGLNEDQFAQDMKTPAIDTHLAVSKAAARQLGIWATPALVVGRTVVQGAIDQSRLRRLIRLETAEPQQVCA